MNTGRKLVKKYKYMIDIFTKIFLILPTHCVYLIFMAFKSNNDKISLLVRFLSIKKLSKGTGYNIYIGSNTILKNIENLTLGNNVSIHDNCYIDASGEITIGNNVSIAHQTSILSAEHTWQDNKIPIKYNPVNLKPTIIEDDVWIGCGVRILAGVTIKTRSIVAAGAVVTKDVESGTIVGGVPAKLMKKITD